MNKIAIAIILSMLLLATQGCGTNPEQKNKNQTNVKNETSIQFDSSKAQQINETVQKVKGVKDSTAVVMNDEISVAIKVTGFDRLRLKPIKQEVQRTISKSNQGYTIYVTSDKKLFAQLQQIEEKIKSQHVQSKTEVISKVKKINKNMNG